jgi:WD40 repeat protein
LDRKGIDQNKETPVTIDTPRHEFDVASLAVSAKGDYCASASGFTVQLWKTGSADVLRSLTYDQRVVSVVFDRDDRELVIGLRGGTIEIRNAPTFELVRTLEIQPSLTSLAFTGDGKYLVSTDTTNKRTFWETGDWTMVDSIQASAPIAGAAFQPRGSGHAVYSTNLVWLWKSPTVVEEIRLDGVGTIGATAFSGDGRHLLIGSSSGVRVWDIRSSAEVGRIGQSLAVRGLALSPDDRLLAITYADGSAQLTLWKDKDLIAEVCRRLNDETAKPVDISRFLPPGIKPEHGCAVRQQSASSKP